MFADGHKPSPPPAIFTALAILLMAVTAAPAGTVGSVQDGDTFCTCGKDRFVIRFAGCSKACASTCVGVRICGIDASERGQAGLGEAKRKLADLTQGKTVRCVPVGGGAPCDRRSQLMNSGQWGPPGSFDAQRPARFPVGRRIKSSPLRRLIDA